MRLPTLCTQINVHVFETHKLKAIKKEEGEAKLADVAIIILLEKQQEM